MHRGKRRKPNAETQEGAEKRRPAFSKGKLEKVGHPGKMQSQNRFAVAECGPPAKVKIGSWQMSLVELQLDCTLFIGF